MEQTIKKPSLKENIADFDNKWQLLQPIVLDAMNHTAIQSHQVQLELDDMIEIVKNIKMAYDEEKPSIENGVHTLKK